MKNRNNFKPNIIVNNIIKYWYNSSVIFMIRDLNLEIKILSLKLNSSHFLYKAMKLFKFERKIVIKYAIETGDNPNHRLIIPPKLLTNWFISNFNVSTNLKWGNSAGIKLSLVLFAREKVLVMYWQ